jgi:hypothetical protein
MRIGTSLRGRRPIGLAVVTAAAAATVGLAVPAVAAPDPAANGTVLTAGQTGSRATVPWRRVGPGWTLAMFSRDSGAEGNSIKYGPSTLYLVDPRGGRYALKSWPAHSAGSHWLLRAWSGDTLRALFTSAGASDTVQVHQLQLRTGRITSFVLPANRAVVGYTRPDGLNILVAKWAPTFTRGTLQRYSLTGGLVKTLASVDNPEESAYEPAGGVLATVEKNGLVLVSNGGGVVRKLPVPGVRFGCNPVRWWTASTILASCMSTSQHPWQRLWLVPVSGARPTALTPQRPGDTFDLGDLNAWQLKSGLYLNAAQGCGAGTIGRQPARGPERQVQVPGAGGEVIVNATATRLEVERFGGCVAGTSMVWFNPVTRAVTVALGTSGAEFGVEGAIPYFVTGKF